jgi:membrane fusion protein
MSSLFRTEAIQSRRRRLLGVAVIAHPPAVWLLGGLVLASVTAAAVFVATASYARKATVFGYLSPDTGIVRVFAPRPGIAARVGVSEGDFVPAGAPLVSLLAEMTSEGGVDVNENLLAAIDEQIDEAASRRSLELRRRAQEAARIAAQIGSHESERIAIGRRISMQSGLVRNLRSALQRYEDVARRGYVSADDLRRRENELLTNRLRLAGLEQERADVDRRLRQSRSLLADVPVDSDRRLSDLKSLRAGLLRQRTELLARASVVVTAPLAGRVTALTTFTGETVTSEFPLLTILPEGGRLEAHLLVPTRAIGFVRVGQEVRLRLDAFDYRRFGSREGTVTTVSSSVFLPTETRFATRIGEPSYRVIVRLDDQSVRAYGNEFFLRAGMTLRADIILERRSLLDWLLDPLLGLRGRV